MSVLHITGEEPNLYLCEVPMNLSPAHDQFGFLVSDQLQALEILQRAGVQRLQDLLPGLL